MECSFEHREPYGVSDSSTDIHLVTQNNPERQLSAEYEMAIRFYSWAISELEDADLVFKDSRELVVFAKEACELARLALEDFRTITR